MSGGFTFGGNPSDGSGDGGQPPDDRDRLMRQIQEMERRMEELEIRNTDLNRANIELRVQNEATLLRLEQTEQMLGDTTAPTVFNQIQVN